MCFLFLNVGVACHYYGVKECCACAQRKIVCFLFLYVEVACHYYGAKMLRMRITGNCVFLYVRVACRYYGAKIYACVQQNGKQICNINISLFNKGIQ